MNGNVARVLKGVLNLSSVDREELIKELNRYQQLGYDFQRKNFQEEVQRASVGPKNTICDCCGR